MYCLGRKELELIKETKFFEFRKESEINKKNDFYFCNTKKTKSGIILTDDTVQESQLTTNICKVLKVGPDAYKDKDKFPTGPWCKHDDWVLITRYAGSRIRIDGGELRIINDDEILAVIDDPRDILPANIL